MNINSIFSSFIRAVVSKEGLKGLPDSPLYTNAGYLVADTAVVSLLGFAFWAWVARLYTPTQVGETIPADSGSGGCNIICSQR